MPERDGFVFKGLAEPKMVDGTVPSDDDLRLTLTSADPEGLRALLSFVEKALAKPAARRSPVQRTGNGRVGITLSFQRGDLGLGTAKASTPAKEAAKEPTEEQLLAADAFGDLGRGESQTIRAYAGSGKTWFLRYCADREPKTRFLYLAFNAAIAAEAKRSFPGNVECVTSHALARRQIRSTGREDLGIAVRTEEAALAVGMPIRLGTMNQRTAARFVLETVENFCNSDATSIGRGHVPDHVHITLAGLDERILTFARKLWSAMSEGRLPLSHSGYLKLWQILLVEGKAPPLRYDAVLFDEAQDSNPVTSSIVDNIDARIMRVGDSFQQIYAWRGAVDALDDGRGREFHLTASFRFGPNIASVANNVLRMHPATFGRRVPPLRGLGRPDRGDGDTLAILCRSNAGLFEEALSAAEAGRSIFILGGNADLKAMVDGASDLHRGRRPTRGPFAEFPTWSDAVADVEAGTGREVAFVVRRVEQKGIATLLNDLASINRAFVDETVASTILATIHKAKGREWPTVRIANDLPTLEDIQAKIENPSGKSPVRNVVEEINLLYVAVTRATTKLLLPRGLKELQDPGFSYRPGRRE